MLRRQCYTPLHVDPGLVLHRGGVDFAGFDQVFDLRDRPPSAIFFRPQIAARRLKLRADLRRRHGPVIHLRADTDTGRG